MWLCQNASFDTTTFVSFVMNKKNKAIGNTTLENAQQLVKDFHPL